MLAATALDIFFIPALFVFVERLTSHGERKREEPAVTLPNELPRVAEQKTN
jgi:hypothetical protein